MASLDKLLADYGVAYYTFDENSGAVNDQIGLSQAGTVTGAVRTQGWNGYGNALRFNGVDQFVQFPSSIFPTSNMTLRFKLKTSQPTFGNIIGTENRSAFYGLYLGVTNLGIIRSYGLKGVAGEFGYTIMGSKKINDNKWHDILLTVDISNKKVTLTIDGDVDVSSVTSAFTNHLHSSNLTFGRSAGTGDLYFNGEMDSVEIYNKALYASDFPQERVVMKASHNFSLPLSPISTRIKEIPNVNTNTLLAQGTTIREINHATDNSSQFDLEKSIDEYEVVSDTVSPLGSGKSFTISTTQEFKTISIEDNY